MFAQVCGKLTLASKAWAAGDPFISNMYAATFGRLNSQDQDLEVRPLRLLLVQLVCFVVLIKAL
jgi:hypothetical protein